MKILIFFFFFQFWEQRKLDFIKFFFVFFYFYPILFSHPILCNPTLIPRISTLISSIPIWFPTFLAFLTFLPHSPHSQPDTPHSRLDSPRSHPDSQRSNPFLHSVPRFPIPAFTDSLLLISLSVNQTSFFGQKWSGGKYISIVFFY